MSFSQFSPFLVFPFSFTPLPVTDPHHQPSVLWELSPWLGIKSPTAATQMGEFLFIHTHCGRLEFVLPDLRPKLKMTDINKCKIASKPWTALKSVCEIIPPCDWFFLAKARVWGSSLSNLALGDMMIDWRHMKVHDYKLDIKYL